jgi:tRNA(Ile)-lysidine synthase
MVKRKEEELTGAVKETIIKHGLIRGGDLVLAGVSGGADSLCLLHVLYCLSKSMGFAVEAVHVNHMLRGAESDGDEKFVESICNDWGIKLSVLRRDVRRLKEEEGFSLEEAARYARYEAFEECADNIGADRIAVAHNRNDQAETILMNIMRGTGLDGLTGMDYTRGRIIRPLLDVDRADIEEYCRGRGLIPRTDSSNFDNTLTRNKVRNRLIPFIKELFYLDPVDGISRMAGLLKEDAKHLEKEAARPN